MEKPDKTRSYETYSLNDILILLVKRLNIPRRYAKIIFEEYISTHPSYPSFAALSYGLTRAGIENVGAMVDFETLKKDVDLPIVAHLNRENGVFVLVNGIDEQGVSIVLYKETECIPTEEFKEVFSGNILIYDREAKSVNVSRQHMWNYWMIPIAEKCIPIFMLLLFLLFYRPVSIFAVLYTLCFALGLGLSSLLFAKQMGFSDKLIDRICSGGKDSSVQCNSVLASKGAKIVGIIGWSDVGVIYFSTLLLSSLFFDYELLLPLILLISFCSIPYIFYSVYYQWKVVKAWCPLCLGVQAIFAVQFIFSLIIFPNVNWSAINSYTFAGFVLLGLLIAGVVFSIKPLIISRRQAINVTNYLRKIKFNPQVKEVLLSNQPTSTDNMQKITFFPEAKNQIIFVFSPTCAPCVAKIELLLSYLENYEEVGVEFIFFQKDMSSKTESAVMNHLIESYCIDEDSFITALRTYVKEYPHNQKGWENYEPQPAFIKQVESIRFDHMTWCMTNNITGTPTIFFNNQKFPDFYVLEDIFYLL